MRAEFPPSEQYLDNDSDSGVEDLHDSETGTEIVSQEPEPAIAKQETQDVFRTKVVVLFVLVVAALSSAGSVFMYLENSEASECLKQFESDSTKIFDSIGINLDKTLGAMDSVAVSMVSAARITNQSWPYVTVPDFAVRVAKVLTFSDANVMSFAPVVTHEQREKWEEYSVEHDHWINESMAIQAKWDGYYGPMEYKNDHYHVVHGDFGEIPRNIR
jgi:hypothetical protein